MTDDTTEDTSGRLVAFKNPEHTVGGKQPAFRGTIHPEGSADKRNVVLWVRASKKSGETYLSGSAGETAAAQIERLVQQEPVDREVPDAPELTHDTGTQLELKPHDVVLFKNKNKERGSNQPDYYGYYSPGPEQKLQRLDVWARNDKYGRPMLSGNVADHELAKEKARARGRSRSAA
jgi:hypothetical protein